MFAQFRQVPLLLLGARRAAIPLHLVGSFVTIAHDHAPLHAHLVAWWPVGLVFFRLSRLVRACDLVEWEDQSAGEGGSKSKPRQRANK